MTITQICKRVSRGDIINVRKALEENLIERDLPVTEENMQRAKKSLRTICSRMKEEKGETFPLTFMADRNDIEKLEKLSKETMMTRSRLIRMAIRNFLKEYDEIIRGG